MFNLTAAQVLPLVFMGVMGLALLAYVVLDGYDLGVGLLLPFARDDQKDVMVASIGPFWDANETWLALGVGVLLIAFPLAHGLVRVALAGISLATPLVSHTVFERWFALPQFIALLPIPVACAVAFFASWHVLSRPALVRAGYGWIVFASTVLIFVLSFLGLAYSLYP